jgi:hypothetical protein
VGPNEGKRLDLKIRGLYVDSRTKEFTLGTPHDITESLFVVRRVFRVNDHLPVENASAPRHVWERGGRLLVDRITGHVSAIALPEFDSYYSVASWYRDYVAYCGGVSDDGKKLFGRRLSNGTAQAGIEKIPWRTWRRRHARFRVSGAGVGPPSCASYFRSGRGPKSTYTVRGHAADLVTGDGDEEEENASH